MGSHAHRVLYALSIALVAGCATRPGNPVEADRADDSPDAAEAASLHGVVLDADGKPVAEAWVGVYRHIPESIFVRGEVLYGWNELREIEHPVFENQAEGQRIGCARAGNDGGFALPGVLLAEGDHILAYHPLYEAARIQAKDTPGGGVGAGPVRIVLRRGLTIRGVVRAKDGGAVSGACVAVQKVYRERVKWDNDGEPPDGGPAEVEAIYAEMVVELGNVRLVHTAPDGSYRIGGLLKGMYLLAAWTPSHIANETTLDLSDAQAVTTHDVALRDGETVSVMATYTHSHEPCEGAHVTLEKPYVWWRSQPLVAEGYTDAEGRWSYGGLQRGTYSVGVVIDRPGVKPTVGRSVCMAPDAASMEAQTGDECRVAIDPTFSVRGTVVSAADGRAVTSFSVTLVPEDFGWVDISSAGDEADAAEPKDERVRGGRSRISAHGTNGSFDAPRARPGLWSVHVSASGYLPGDAEVDLPMAGPWAEVSVRLEPATGTASGRVVDDATGVALLGVSVTCVQQYQRRLRRHTNKLYAATDEAGRFRIDGLVAPGTARGTNPERSKCRITFARGGYAAQSVEFAGREGVPDDMGTVRMKRAEPGSR